MKLGSANHEEKMVDLVKERTQKRLSQVLVKDTVFVSILINTIYDNNNNSPYVVINSRRMS